MKYQDLVESVRDQAGLDSTGEAREAVQAVLATLAHCLPPEDRRRVAERLPGLLEPAAEVPGPPEIRDGTGLLIQIGHRLQTTPERARYLSQAVLNALRAGDAELVDHLHSRLSSDIFDVLTPAGEPPRRAASVRAEVPTELSDAEIDQALRHLTGWTGDHTGISRTIQLPPDRLTPLTNRVQREARELNDHAHIEREADTVTVTLNTGQPGVVTEPDLELAERIDRAVAEIGSGGRP
ncbi:DUF2267 domain-containing protein [Amycolatopsis taiwanensis]|uniref:Putative pterin-4-alpha-carbinolamine dehydratase n=1 Tax=Amycolatopsis taiwanensis TaxID=342230 RepID=A0A9W6R5C4_9PSEU|nr:DUF2267 domain-containing protein [Amycolatopsis taiwanensis]GLY67857.1 hypothetical protein Atai01_44760 [Amycolatopsis taiwanensis]